MLLLIGNLKDETEGGIITMKRIAWVSSCANYAITEVTPPKEPPNYWIFQVAISVFLNEMTDCRH